MFSKVLPLGAGSTLPYNVVIFSEFIAAMAHVEVMTVGEVPQHKWSARDNNKHS